MNKNDQIAELKDSLANAREYSAVLSRNCDNWKARWGLKKANEARMEAEAAAIKKQAEEDETLKQIRGGMIPIEAMRAIVKADYEVLHTADSTLTTMEFRLLSGNKVDQAVLHALLEDKSFAGTVRRFAQTAGTYADSGGVWRDESDYMGGWRVGEA